MAAPPLLESIDTRTCRWVARGELRDIFEHPDLPGALVKVIRTDRVDAEGNVVGWSRRKFILQRRFGIYLGFMREFRETFRAARRLYAHPEVALPFARPLGLAVTERGLALIVEKITGPDGSLAPSIKQLLREGGLTDAHRAAIDRFFDVCADNHLVFGDLNAGNLVLAGDGRFVCIDGIGEKSLIPLHELSRRLNARKLRRVRKRLRRYIEARLPRPAPASDGVPAAN
jgi:hypothetical protein